MPRRKSISAEERYYTIREAAARANVHPSTIRRSIKDGQLVATNIRGAVRVRKSHLDEYLLAGE